MLRIYVRAKELFPRNSCRYYPSCSIYMEQAVVKHGLFAGLWLGIKRILKCNQLFPGGYDPVP